MVVASLITGVLVGALVAGFEKVTVGLLLEELFKRPLWQLAIAPFLGLAIATALLRFAGFGTDSSTSDEYVRAFHERSPHLPLRELPAKMLAGVATIGLGGAVGLEGPSIYAGSSIGLNLQDRFHQHFRREEVKVLLTAGAAAGVAAIFQAPATGVIFALEAPYRDDVTRRALLPSLFAAATAYATFVLLVGTEPVLPFFGRVQQDLRLTDIAGGAVVGLLAGFVARWVAWAVQRAKSLAKTTGPMVRVLVGGAVLGVLVITSDLVFDEPTTLGPGVNALEWLTGGDHSLGLIAALFGFRIAATLTTVAAGGTGGLFIPLAVQGVIMGRFVGAVIDDTTTGLYATLGLAALLGAGYRAPIAAVMFVAESNGAGAAYVVPALIAAAASQLTTGGTSVASYQRSVRLGHLERRFTLPITAALSTDVLTAPSDATASEFVYIHVLGRREREVPVVDDGKYTGMCSLDQLREVPREHWDDVVVGSLVNTGVPVATPSWTIRDAVKAMDSADIDQMAVIDNEGNFIGVVRADDILKLDEILDQTEG
jgi:CIC family chloride channel protein